MMDLNSYLSQCSVAIVKHTYTPTGGAEQELLRYLLPRAKAVAYVSHPFPDARGVPLNTAVSFFERGEHELPVAEPQVRRAAHCPSPRTDPAPEWIFRVAFESPR